MFLKGPGVGWGSQLVVSYKRSDRITGENAFSDGLLSSFLDLTELVKLLSLLLSVPFLLARV